MDNNLPDFPLQIQENNNLPSFPESNDRLSSEELRIVREMITDYKSKQSQKLVELDNSVSEKKEPAVLPQEPMAISNLFTEEPETPSATVSVPAPLIFSEKDSDGDKISAIQLLEKQKLGDPFESEAFNKMIEYSKSADEASVDYIAVSILGLVPCKKFIRHGTPEQKLFALKSLGDRFLDGIAGIKWVDRRKLIKAVANYLSALSENYNFIPMEGENFNPTLHERVLGASAGNIIKEMRGFLVVARGTNRVTYAGVVLT